MATPASAPASSTRAPTPDGFLHAISDRRTPRSSPTSPDRGTPRHFCKTPIEEMTAQLASSSISRMNDKSPFSGLSFKEKVKLERAGGAQKLFIDFGDKEQDTITFVTGAVAFQQLAKIREAQATRRLLQPDWLSKPDSVFNFKK